MRRYKHSLKLWVTCVDLTSWGIPFPLCKRGRGNIHMSLCENNIRSIFPTCGMARARSIWNISPLNCSSQFTGLLPVSYIFEVKYNICYQRFYMHLAAEKNCHWPLAPRQHHLLADLMLLSSACLSLWRVCLLFCTSEDRCVRVKQSFTICNHFHNQEISK